MATRHIRRATVFEYQPLHISAAATLQPVGLCVSTTSATVITAGSGVVVTPASMLNIVPGMVLNIANGTGAAEDIVVLGITATTFTANFVTSHSGAYTILSRRGVFLGQLIINKAGSGVTITLYNGHPSLPDAGVVFAIISPPTGSSIPYQCSCPKGLFYTVAGSTIGDYTLTYLDHSN